jgi:hypothetical protein
MWRLNREALMKYTGRRDNDFSVYTYAPELPIGLAPTLWS